MQLDGQVIAGWIINGLITFTFGILSGVVSHWAQHQMDMWWQDVERRERIKQRIAKARKYTHGSNLRRLVSGLMVFFLALILGVMIGYLWLFIGASAVIGFVVGMRWGG